MAARRKGQTQAPPDLTVDEKRDLWRWAQEKYPWMTKGQVREAVDDCLEWHQAKGSTWADWKLVAMRWIRGNVKDGTIRELAPIDEEPEWKQQERAERKRYERRVLEEREKIGPLGIAALIAEERKKLGW